MAERHSLPILERASLRVENDDTPAPPPPARTLVSEPMLRFACNQKGCCCAGWDIPFTAADFVRLHDHLDDAERELLRKDMELVYDEAAPDEEARLRSVKLDGVGDDARCRFLEPAGGCGVHARHGLAALPNLCVDFPVVPYLGDADRAELYYEPICPEVLNQLGESDEPLRLTTLGQPLADAGLALRSRHAKVDAGAWFDAGRLSAEARDVLRAEVIGALGRHDVPVWRHLAAISGAYARLAARDEGGKATSGAREFELDYDADAAPFLRFLFASVGVHGPELLDRVFRKYRRFVYSLDVNLDAAPWTGLAAALADWESNYARWLAPSEDALRPLHLRYLAHRHFAPFLPVQGEMFRAADSIVHAFATALRYAAAFGAVLQRPVDRDMMKVALGAGEYLYRSLKFPSASLPWFDPRG